jgi:hypothetical protein
LARVDEELTERLQPGGVSSGRAELILKALEITRIYCPDWSFAAVPARKAGELLGRRVALRSFHDLQVVRDRVRESQILGHTSQLIT